MNKPKTLDCLIVRQPFASLIVFGVKRWEFRSYASTKKGLIAIAASRNPAIPTADRRLNQAAQSVFPKGVVLGTANLTGSRVMTADELRHNFRCCQQVRIHGLAFTVACQPIGEPPDDVRMACSTKDWRRHVWEFENVRPVLKPSSYTPAHGSSWTKADVSIERDLMSFV